MCFKIFVVVITKEGLVGVRPRQSLFGYDTDCRFTICSLHRIHLLVGVILKKRIDGALPTNPSFGMTMTKIFRHIFPLHGSFFITFQKPLLLSMKHNIKYYQDIL